MERTVPDGFLFIIFLQPETDWVVAVIFMVGDGYTPGHCGGCFFRALDSNGLHVASRAEKHLRGEG